MTKIKINQPFASMIMSGRMNTIPIKIDKVAAGEKIYIYADQINPDFYDGLDYNKPLHRKVYNEMFFGYIPDRIFPCGKFLGYVIAEEIIKSRGCKRVKVSLPRIFQQFINNYDCEEEEFLNRKASAPKVSQIVRWDNDLYLPVSRTVMEKLNDTKNWKNINFFWEKYMKESIPNFLCFSKDMEEIERVFFTYRKKTIGFNLEWGVNCNPLPELSKGKNKLVWYVHIELEGRVNEGSIPKIEESDDYYLFRPIQLYSDTPMLNDSIKNEIKEFERKPYNPYVRIISTPMGGMTRWKR